MASNSYNLRAAFEAQFLNSKVGDGTLSVINNSTRDYEDPHVQDAWIWFQRGWSSHMQDLHKQMQQLGIGDRMYAAINTPPEPKV